MQLTKRISTWLQSYTVVPNIRRLIVTVVFLIVLAAAFAA